MVQKKIWGGPRTFRLTLEDDAKLMAAIKESGMNQGEYLRKLILQGEKPEPKYCPVNLGERTDYGVMIEAEFNKLVPKIQAALNLPDRGDEQFKIIYWNDKTRIFMPSEDVWFYALKDALELTLNEVIEKTCWGCGSMKVPSKILTAGHNFEQLALVDTNKR